MKRKKNQGKNEVGLKGKPKVLIIASVASMIGQFNMQNIILLQEKGFDVEVAANFKKGSSFTEEEQDFLWEELKKRNVTVYHVPIPRKITDVLGILKSLRKVKLLCDKKQYQLVHCHSPIGSVVARFAAAGSRRNGTKVIYTAHGFHFYKGAPLKNWILYYTAEWICSFITDVQIAINKEDYKRAEKMHAKQVVYLPGVGIDLDKFKVSDENRTVYREELNIPEDATVLLSIGELNVNKNHEVVLKALAQLSDPKIHYVIAGIGFLEKQLKELIYSLGISKQVHLLGYREDIVELCNMSDVYVHPSFREGLPVSLMEAMACGLPCVVSRIRGNVDLIDKQGGVLFNPKNATECRAAIENVLNRDREKMKRYNLDKIKGFALNRVMAQTWEIYANEVYGENEKETELYSSSI